MRVAIRPYVAVAQYPGLEEFMLGTVSVDAQARHDEIVAALTKHALTFLPPGFEVKGIVAGALFFLADSDA